MTPAIRHCEPKSDGISSHEDLLSKPVLRYSTWGMALLTCIGNGLVLWGRITLKDENRNVSIVIRNLAFADLMMGIYLFIVGIQDHRFRSKYFEFVHEWIGSGMCISIGVLAMISSEVSMLIMTFISIERFLLIAGPFGGYQKMDKNNVYTLLMGIWMIGISIAIIPVYLWRSSTMFYGFYSGTCFPLHLNEKYSIGWQYSAIIFIGFNSVLFMLIAVFYSSLLYNIWKTRKATPLALFEMDFIVRFFFIVFTDAICWIPIIIIKIMVFASFKISCN